jgi:hypothetical protein
MVGASRCPCGRLLEAGLDAGGRPVACPACGRLLIPAPSARRHWPRLAAVAILTALVMAGLLILLVRWARPTRSGPPALVVRADDSRVDTGAARHGETEAVARVAEPTPPRPDTGKAEPDAPRDGHPSGPPAGPKPEPAAPARYKAGDTFTQEVVVTRLSAYRILGEAVGQNVQYAFVSRFTINKVERDGGLVVTQTVQEARFSEGDPAMQALLNDALKKTQGLAFEMTLNARGEVTRFKGTREPIKVFAGNNPLAGQTFLLWSFLDEDAWKELAQLTFFQPDGPLRPGEKWSRKLSHSWESLGSWGGQTTYAAAGPQQGFERINYAHDLKYQPPGGAGRDLPFAVRKADFKPLVAGGAILFDPDRRKVANAEETFRVRGGLVVAVGDVEAAVEMDETQVFRLRLTEATPGK